MGFISNCIQNAKEYFTDCTTIGRMVTKKENFLEAGVKSVGGLFQHNINNIELAKSHMTDCTIFGRMVTKDENLFEAAKGSIKEFYS